MAQADIIFLFDQANFLKIKVFLGVFLATKRAHSQHHFIFDTLHQ